MSRVQPAAAQAAAPRRAVVRPRPLEGLPAAEIRISGWLARDAVRATAADGSRSTVDIVISQGAQPPVHARREYRGGGRADYMCASALAARLRQGQRVTVWGYHLTAATRHGEPVLLLKTTTLIEGEDLPARGPMA